MEIQITDTHNRIYRHSPDLDKDETEIVRDADGYGTFKSEAATDAAKINLLGSLTTSGTHKPLLDIDFPARLVPSKTPGHFHLYLDGISLSQEQYGKLLAALREANIIQRGFYKQFEKGGLTSVRPQD